MTRPLDAATALAVTRPILPLAALVYLDIQGDPLYAWSGIGNLPFGAGQTGDPSLDGLTFYGTGTLIEISQVSDGIGGSDALEIMLPGVDTAQPMLRQVVTNRNRWQFRRAVVWLMALDPDTDAIAGKPFRIKTGRMDGMPYSENDKGAVIKCRIEGQQAYGNTPLATRYSEQPDINPADISQKFAYSLSNMTAALGQASTQPGTGSSGGFSGQLSGMVNAAQNAGGARIFSNNIALD